MFSHVAAARAGDAAGVAAADSVGEPVAGVADAGAVVGGAVETPDAGAAVLPSPAHPVTAVRMPRASRPPVSRRVLVTT
jgi:hypothetical protein